MLDSADYGNDDGDGGDNGDDGDGDEDNGGGGDGDNDDDDDGDNGCFLSFCTECPPRPLHLHLCAGTVSLCPGPAGDAGKHDGEVRRGKYLIYVLIYVLFY